MDAQKKMEKNVNRVSITRKRHSWNDDKKEEGRTFCSCCVTRTRESSVLKVTSFSLILSFAKRNKQMNKREREGEREREERERKEND